MAPESQCLNRESMTENHHSFLNRVLALPAFDQAATVYRITKEQQDYVGGAIRLAEAGIMKTVAATGVVIPLATPIANHVVGGWSVVDGWACQCLDSVVKVAPIITKPTDEIVDDTREFVMKSLAGPQQQEQPLTLKTALSSRASDVMVRASSTEYGQAIHHVADAVLLSAHRIVDIYLPASEGDLHHSDGYEGDINNKIFSLAQKTHTRLKRNTLEILSNVQAASNNSTIVKPYMNLVRYSYHKNADQHIQKAVAASLTMKSIAIEKLTFLHEMMTHLNTVVRTEIKDRANGVCLRTTKALEASSSYGIHFGHSIKGATNQVVESAASMGGLALHTVLSLTLISPTVVIKKGTVFLESVQTNGLDILQKCVNQGKFVLQHIIPMEFNVQVKSLATDISDTVFKMKDQAFELTSAFKNYCREAIEKSVLMIPPSVYIKVHSLYVQFLLSTCIYPEKILQKSQEGVRIVKCIPENVFLWLNKETVGRIHSLFICFQKRYSSVAEASCSKKTN